MNFLDLLSEYTEYKKIKKTPTNTPLSIAGVVESAQPQLVAQMSNEHAAVVVLYSDMEAKAFERDLQFFAENVYLFPSKEYIFYSMDSAGHAAEYERLSALNALAERKNPLVVTSLEAILQYTLPKDIFKQNILRIKLGNIIEPAELVEKLTDMGYRRESLVEGKGQFSVRGGIVDIYTPDSDNPVRIEFFDNEIDSLREFDIISQRSVGNITETVIFPCSEIILDQEKRKEISANLKKEAKRLETLGRDEAAARTENDAELFACGEIFPHADKYISAIYDKITTVTDYLPEDGFVFLIEPKRLSERAKSIEWEQGELISDLTERDIITLKNMQYWYDYRAFLRDVSKRHTVCINVLNHFDGDIKYESEFNFVTKTTVSFHGKTEYLIHDLKDWHENGYTVIILSGNRTRGENLAGYITDKGFAAEYYEKPKDIKKGSIILTSGSISKGFEYPDIKLVIVPDNDIFDNNARKRKKEKKADIIKSYNDLNIGDYVVHREHGIAKYLGIHRVTVNKITKDYLKLQYQGTDTLYVPVDQLDRLYKYVGGSEDNIKLNKLGGTDWSKTKTGVKKAAKDIAKQLISLYSQREKAKGYAFSEDTPWQKDFEDTFMYQETDDQLQSIEEVKKDMESEKPMDRLLCGDVGYGKTEVALRAAFKAATDSKQVAYLCPTTVLAMQHYNTFRTRMENFPVRIEMLSRFKTPAQQAKILKKVESGEVDILIGTHRILQKDVHFKDLGLLIIDEEQRFGVSDKERLKELKKNIDSLSMTATPIPRTLHMSMINVRDMSILETPPENRYPVQTFVTEQNRTVLADAMKKELARGGQVFYLFNRVHGIYQTAEWIQKLIPEARIAVGHGRMSKEELEDVMYDMINGETDILVCTTIIETGLDIPNANTIIIENADKMGLAQLYQLRGRVGRSNRTAYAYLTYRRDEILSDVAQKRLSAIREFTEFGSGFKVAMRDLEIRGAGNLLGAQQHGHMDAVGYDMYCRILQESVDEALGVTPEEEVNTQLDLQLDAYIPEKYIKDHNQRIDVYKQIAAIKCEEDVSDVIDELCDRFGEPPRTVKCLIEVAKIKSDAKKLGITMLSQKNGKLNIIFDDKKFDPTCIVGLANKMPSKVKILYGDHPKLEYKISEHDGIIANIKFILQSIFELKNDEK